MDEISESIPPQFFMFLRYSAIAGLLAVVTLLMNFNHSKFRNVFGDRSKTYWWLFLAFSVIPLLLFLFIFNFVFGNTDLRQYGELVLTIFGRKGLDASY